MFQYDEEIDVLQMDQNNDSKFFAVQLKNGNAYYYIISDVNINIFKEIVQGLFFESM